MIDLYRTLVKANLLIPRVDQFLITDMRVPSASGTSFRPLATCLHHTASRVSQDPAPSMNTVRKGRGKPNPLAPPLCNELIGRDATIHVIADGKAHDTGSGDRNVLNALRAGSFPLPPPGDTASNGRRIDLTPYFYDVEVENDGVGEPYSRRVVDAACFTSAVHLFILDQMDVRHVVRHRDCTTRKPDWSFSQFLHNGGQPHAWVQSRVGYFLAFIVGSPSPPVPQPPTVEDDPMVAFIPTVILIYQAKHGPTFLPDTAGLLNWASQFAIADAADKAAGGGLHLAAAINELRRQLGLPTG